MPTTGYSKSHVPLHHKLHLFPDFRISEHAALYLTHTIRAFSVTLVGVFLPIYIYRLSSSYLYFHPSIVVNGLLWVLLYYFLRSLFVSIGLPLLIKPVFNRLGFGKSIFISLILLIIEMVLWTLSEGNLHLMIVAGVLAGIKVIFYWIPYHIFFVEKFKTKEGHYGQNSGKRIFFVRMAAGLAPAIGGLVIAAFGFNALFVMSIMLVLVSSIPIFANVHDWSHDKHNLKSVLKNYLFNPKLKLLTLAHFGEGLEAGIYHLWPVLLFLVLRNFAEIGIVNSLSQLISSIAVLYVGKMLDKHGTKVFHGIGVTVNALLHIPRILFSSAPLYYALDVVDRMNSNLYGLPIISLTYEKARKLGRSDYIIFREFTIHTAIAMVSAFAFLLIPSLGNWRYILIVPAIGGLMTFFLDLDKN